jgi:hypothetical protein
MFAQGSVSPEDQSGLDSLTAEQQIGAAAALSGVALLLIILAIVAVVVLVVLLVATTTGVLVYKKHMVDVSDHAFEGQLVMRRSVAVGAVVAAPSWATERGGDGINPTWDMAVRNTVEMQMRHSSLPKGAVLNPEFKGEVANPEYEPSFEDQAVDPLSDDTSDPY